MGWRYRVGLFLIATVVIIWVTSAEVTQGIFKDYKLPFALTYLGASLMNDFSVRICSPLKGNGVEKNFELEMGSAIREDGDLDLSTLAEYPSNAALARTSVASKTVLSSTSGLFTLFIGALMGQDLGH